MSVAGDTGVGPLRPGKLGCSDPRPPAVFPLVTRVGMSAQPVHEPDPDDPIEILHVLPERFHDQFLAEYYEAASEAARQVDGYRQLHDLLRRWRLSAAACSAPGSESACRRCRRLSGSAAWKGRCRSRRSCPAGRTPGELQRQVRGAALVQPNDLPGAVFDALLQRVVDLVQEPWDEAVMPPGKDPATARRCSAPVMDC
jgi:hypothetical protein